MLAEEQTTLGEELSLPDPPGFETGQQQVTWLAAVFGCRRGGFWLWLRCALSVAAALLCARAGSRRVA